ncbi:hypothetical protein Lal_00033926 [Lupinus albus]|nr:hypothetical protein Lal_00033926 [Lupinus albus]
MTLKGRSSRKTSMDTPSLLLNTVTFGTLSLKIFFFLIFCGNKNILTFAANDIYPELVRVFYCNMNFRKNLMTSHVNGKDIVLDMKTFNSICCDIPMIGDITGFDLNFKGGNRKFNIKINWTKMIMNQMWHVRGSQCLLPYAIFITKILEYFGIPLEGETKVTLNLHEGKVDIEVVHKMGFVIDPVTH